MAGKRNTKGSRQQKRLKDEIKAEMNKVSYTRTHRDTCFVSHDSIEALFNKVNPPMLRNSLRADIEASESNEVQSRMDVKRLESYVRDKATKLYCVLLLLDKSQLIVAILHAKPPITDDIFNTMDGDFGPYCSLEYLRSTPSLCNIAEGVFEQQWCIPPVFNPGAHMKYKAEWNFRFPFTNEPERIGQGSFGKVFKVQIAAKHLDAEGHIPGRLIAYKTVKRGHETRWDKMLRERETLRSRQHDSVIPLFASFSAGPEDPPIQDDTTEYLHLFFPHTDAGDMKKWLEMESPPDSLLIGRTARRKFIYQTIQDLASAIAFIHREIKSQIAYHHDLKPSNILLFRQEGRQPLWKICDFGHADLKHAEDTSGTALTDENRFGSYVYRPPEYFARSQDKHGRPFDIYSLGCIFLNLMTVVKHGWSNAGYREFERLRGINNDHIFDVPKGVMEDYSFHNNPTVVTSWVNRLKEGDHDQAFYGLLEIIEEMLQEKNRRIFSWEVDVDIFELLNGGVEEEMLRKRLEAVVQASKTAHSSIDNKHNPLQRAERKGQDWKIDILKQNKWSNWKPETLVTTSADSDVEEWRHSTLDDFAYTHEYVQNQLYGRHDIDKQIAAGFAKWKIVGLYGISGIGKSHLAHYFASRFRDTKAMEHRNHTFWVEAGNRHKLLESLRKIAQKVLGAVPEPDSLIPLVKKWLLNKDNGPWLIVVDGLDNEEFASSIKAFMPILENQPGKILITTTNRGLLKHFVDLKPSAGQCIEVGKLTEQESLDLFRWHNEDVLTDDKMSKFLSTIALPVLIKLIAKHMLEFKIPTSVMYRRFATKRAGLPGLVNQLYDQNHDIFSPLVPGRYDPSAGKKVIKIWQNPTLKLLGELSCLNHARIESELIKTQYEQKDHDDKLAEILGRLENCSFIGKDEHQNYFMSEFVQREVQRRIKNQWDVATLLELHGSALCMLLVRYHDDRKESADSERRSYHLKIRFMPHFDRFLDFVKEHQKSLKSFTGFKFKDRMAASVILFAEVFMDEGRYEDASCVLVFTSMLYRSGKYRHRLVRLLVQAYILPPLARTKKKEWLQSEKLLKDSIHECEGMDKSEERWLSTLTLSDLYIRARHPSKALEQLESLQEFSLNIKRGSPDIFKRKGSKLDESTQRILVVNLRIGEAKAFLMHAKLSNKENARGKGDSYLKKAESAFEEAKIAIGHWFPSQAEWIQIEEGLGNVLCERGAHADLQKADQIFSKLNKRLEIESNAPKRSWSQKKLWDVQCRTAAVWLKMGYPPLKKQAVKKLEKALQQYENCYGTKNDHTRTCAFLLRDAIECTDGERARELQKMYDLNKVNFEDPFCNNGNETGNTALRKIVSVILVGSILLFWVNPAAWSFI